MSEDSPQIQEAEDRKKLDATGEFFSVGVPLHAVRAGYVRRKADDLLFEAAMAGRFAHVLAPERSGKSSLIAATAARLENNGCKVAVLDLEQIGDRDGTDAGRWYYDVVYRLMRQLRIRYDLQSWWQDKSILSNRQRLLDFYTEIILEFIPERHTDFILAVLSEEFGMLGVLLMFCLYLFIAGRGLHIASLARTTYARLLAGSLSLTFFVYVLVNAGMVSGLLPVVGVPLPLVSYGGTSVVTLLAGFGILMSIHGHRNFIR